MTVAILLKHHNISHNRSRHSAGGRPHGTYPETGLEEINGDFLEADFWPGVASG
jgi:hypothetical protein